MFTLTIKTDNAAFREDDDAGDNDSARAAELARILHELARRIGDGISDGDTMPLYDANGNKVGGATFEE